MPDLLVRLYDLPAPEPTLAKLSGDGIEIRRALVPEKHLALRWIAERFSAGWVDECDAAFAREPVACFLAVRQQSILGFACYDAVARGVFGPIGIEQTVRGQSIGSALSLAALLAMRAHGYAYAVIGWAGAPAFFEKAVGAVQIPDSDPGLYRGMLRDGADAR